MKDGYIYSSFRVWIGTIILEMQNQSCGLLKLFAVYAFSYGFNGF